MPKAEVQTQGGEVQGLCLEIGISRIRPIAYVKIQTNSLYLYFITFRPLYNIFYL